MKLYINGAGDIILHDTLVPTELEDKVSSLTLELNEDVSSDLIAVWDVIEGGEALFEEICVAYLDPPKDINDASRYPRTMQGADSYILLEAHDNYLHDMATEHEMKMLHANSGWVLKDKS